MSQGPAAAEAIVLDRQALHRIPEIGLDLPLTADYCERALIAMGLAPRRVGHGLVADLGPSGPRFAWRADMDGLPVQEETGLDCASTIPGRMHACGHDAHMAVALGIARHFTTGGATPPCGIRLIFQPGEELWGGAARMIQDGVLEGVRAIAGLHVGSIYPELPPGCFGTRLGPVMASINGFEVTFKGRGTHGAYPHQGADPLLAACHFGAGLQTTRYVSASPSHPTVVSMGSLHAGTASNVLPEIAVAAGSYRATTAADQSALGAHLARWTEGIAAAHGVAASLHDTPFAPVTANSDAGLAGLLEQAVGETCGAERFMWFEDPVLAGEDFGEYLLRVPGVYFFLGTAPGGNPAPHHHPRFQVAEAWLPEAVPVVAALLGKWAASINA